MNQVFYPLRVEKFEKTCGACPSQWEGTTKGGQWFYIRFRHGLFSLGIGDDFSQALRTDTFSTGVMRDGGMGDGVMDDDDMKAITSSFLDWSNASYVENLRER